MGIFDEKTFALFFWVFYEKKFPQITNPKTQPTFTCSNSTKGNTRIIHEAYSKLSIKYNRTTSVTCPLLTLKSLLTLKVNTLLKFKYHVGVVSMVDFEQVNAEWEQLLATKAATRGVL